jgi:hypothetical protein
MPGPEGAPVQQCTGATLLMIGVLTKDQPQVPFVGDQHLVQALSAGAPHPALRDRVAPHRQLHLIRMIGTDAPV